VWIKHFIVKEVLRVNPHKDNSLVNPSDSAKRAVRSWHNKTKLKERTSGSRFCTSIQTMWQGSSLNISRGKY
jgi:hypothetical protein